jgi:hypothetical protein
MSKKEVKNGVALIFAERRRQVYKLGYNKEHDMQHEEFELAQAAACYTACSAGLQIRERKLRQNREIFEDPWPFTRGSDSRPWGEDDDTVITMPRGTTLGLELLVKAGAMLAAEIDRLKRRYGTAVTIRWSMGKGDGVTYISRTLPRCLDTKLYDFARIATCYAASAGNINLRVLDSKPNREAYVDPWPHLYKPDHRPRRDGELTFPSEPEERVQMLALAGGYTVKAIEHWRRGPALKE